MKPYLCIFLCIALLFALLGCQSNEDEILEPVSFYYRVRTDNQEQVPQLIESELRDASKLSGDILTLLNCYIEGPDSSKLFSPFPPELQVLSCITEQEKTTITLSSEFSQLSGTDLSIACACITLTTAGLLNTAQVTIIADNSLLDGKNMITMDVNNLLLNDSLE